MLDLLFHINLNKAAIIVPRECFYKACRPSRIIGVTCSTTVSLLVWHALLLAVHIYTTLQNSSKVSVHHIQQVDAEHYNGGSLWAMCWSEQKYGGVEIQRGREIHTAHFIKTSHHCNSMPFTIRHNTTLICLCYYLRCRLEGRKAMSPLSVFIRLIQKVRQTIAKTFPFQQAV